MQRAESNLKGLKAPFRPFQQQGRVVCGASVNHTDDQKVEDSALRQVHDGVKLTPVITHNHFPKCRRSASKDQTKVGANN